MRIGSRYIAVALAMALAGCSDRKGTVAADSGILPGLKPEAILLRVNGRDYTCGDFNREVDECFRLFSHGLRKPLAMDKAVKVKDRLAKSILQQSVDKMLIWTALADSSPEAARVERTRNGYAKRFRGKGESGKEFRSWLKANGLVARFEDMVAYDVRLDDYLAHNFADDLEVTDEQVEKWKKRIDRENAVADATNAVIYAFATNLCLRARAGEDFAALVKAHSQADDAADGGDMGECDRDTFDRNEDEAWLAVSALREGEVSDPVPTNDGLTVFKCVRRVAKSELTDKPAVCLSRICLHRALKYEDFDEDGLRAELAQVGRRDAMRKLMEGLRKAAKVEFPSGTKWFPDTVVKLYTGKETIK